MSSFNNVRYSNLIVAIVVGISYGSVVAQGCGIWSAAGDLAEGRSHTAALRLADGRVLVAGGSYAPFGATATVALDTSEIFDPATGLWTSTGNLSVARLFPTGGLLFDGRAIIAGGGFTAGPSADIWNPATGTYSPTMPMATNRALAASAMLADGRFLVIGGFEDPAGTASAEVFDPSTGTWAPAGTMSTARWAHAATLLLDGRVLITGGSAGGAKLASSEIWDPSTGAFTPGPSMSIGRSQHTMTLLIDGRVLIAGGIFIGEESTGAEFFDPATSVMTPISMAEARYGHGAAPLPGGLVLITGGVNSPPQSALMSAEIFDPLSSTFFTTVSMSQTRTVPTAINLLDGRVLVISGSTLAALPSTTESCELFAYSKCGDCDGNGTSPTILDALVAAQIAIGVSAPSVLQMMCCDVDSSATIDIIDALRIALSAAGLPMTLSCA